MIFIDFKEVNGSDLETLKQSLRLAIHTCFCDHEYLLKSKMLSDSEKRKF